MKTLINELKRMNFDATTICLEEGYLLTYTYVEYFLYKSGRYNFLKSNFTFEDILDDIYETCIRRDLFNKFQPTKDYLEGKSENTGKKAYVKLAVQRMLIDMNKYWRDKLTISADATQDLEENEGDNLYNTLPDNRVNIQDEVENRLLVQKVIDSLDDSKGNATGFSTIWGESRLNEKTILIHIMNGYTVTDIANIYTNNGKPVARTYVSRLIKGCKKYFQDVM